MMETLLGLAVVIAVVVSLLSAGNVEYQHQRTKHGKSDIRVVEASNREPVNNKTNLPSVYYNPSGPDMADDNTILFNQSSCIKARKIKNNLRQEGQQAS